MKLFLYYKQTKTKIMKKLLLSTIGLATGLGAFAQLPASQTAANKNVILEEFTGIHCF